MVGLMRMKMGLSLTGHSTAGHQGREGPAFIILFFWIMLFPRSRVDEVFEGRRSIHCVRSFSD
jgi:hypothetical protein